MDLISWLLSRKYTDNSILGISGVLSGKNATIESAQKVGSDTTIVFKWTADNGTVRRTSIVVTDGDTPAISSTPIAHGHRLAFTTANPTQSVTFDVLDGNDGAQGVSVVGADVDNNNYLKLTLSNGNVISAGQIKAVTNVDPTLSPTSSNPVENKVITAALDTKVDKETGKGLFSDEEKAKLASIEDGAQVNVLEKLIINGQEATITDKSIALTLITSAVSNLQNYYLKTETYTKQEVEDLIGQTVGVTIEIVEQLPTEGQSNVIYFLPTESEGVYSQYIYTADGWILIGSTTVDLSNYYTKAQVDTLLNGKQNVLTIDSFPTALSNNPVASGGVYTAIARMQPQFQFTNMPVPSASNVGFVYQYIGTAGTYEPNMFYRCVYKEDIGEYQWVEVIFHATVTIDSALSSTSTNPVQNKVIKEALDKKQNVMQYSILPSAQDNLGAIVQYMGATTSDYTNGFFYKSIYDTESASYIWVLVEFAANITVDSALSTTSENPVQNKAITNKIGEIEDLIPSEASSTNQLVDRDSLGTASQKNFTPYVSPDNADVPLSSSVYSAITSAVYGAYHPSGSKTIAELTSDLLVFANIGNVYKITEDGVTTSLFVGGAGQTIHTGDNAVVVYGGQPNTFLFDLQSGSIDLTPYQTKALGSTIEGETTVEGALGALSTNKASKVSGATNGNFAGLDANGNLTDSGKGVGNYLVNNVDSQLTVAGWYKIATLFTNTGSYGTSVIVELTSDYNSSNNASVVFVIGKTYGTQTCTVLNRTGASTIFTKARIIDKYLEVYYDVNQTNYVFANLLYNKSHGGTVISHAFEADSNTGGTEYSLLKTAWDNKADKVASAIDGDLASLDANGNLVDSGVVASSVIRRISNPTTAVDCNDLIDLYTEYRVGDGDANRPTTDSTAYILKTFRSGITSTTYSQIAYRIGGVAIYRRYCSSSGVWTSWEKLVTESELGRYQTTTTSTTTNGLGKAIKDNLGSTGSYLISIVGASSVSHLDLIACYRDGGYNVVKIASNAMDLASSSSITSNDIPFTTTVLSETSWIVTATKIGAF